MFTKNKKIVVHPEKSLTSLHPIKNKNLLPVVQFSKCLAHPQPPLGFLLIGQWFRFGVVLFLLLSVLLGTTSCSTSAATTSWSDATRMFKVETVQKIVAENSELNPQKAASDVLAWTVDGQAGRLVVFDFNNPGVCGTKGCLYVAYLVRNNTSFEKVFLSYLNPNLPVNKPLFQTVEAPSTTSGLPCLQVQQLSGNNIRQLLFCFNGREYQLAKTSVIDMTFNH